MAFDFPSSPAEGQIFNAPGGPSYVFNTPVWKAVGQGQIAIISDTPPASPANGALWYESDSGILFIWYNDGNSSQWVQVGGIQAGAPVPPAADNAEYVMANGGWRLKSQVFDLAGVTEALMWVPAWGPTQARITLYFYHSVATANASAIQVSIDGATFPSGATAYTYGGFGHSTGTNAFTNAPPAAGSNWLMTPTVDNVTVAITADAVVNLTRNAGSSASYRVRGTGYGNPAVTLMSDQFLEGYLNAASFPGTSPLKGIRWFIAGAAPASGRLVVEWLP